MTNFDRAHYIMIAEKAKIMLETPPQGNILISIYEGGFVVTPIQNLKIFEKEGKIFYQNLLWEINKDIQFIENQIKNDEPSMLNEIGVIEKNNFHTLLQYIYQLPSIDLPPIPISTDPNICSLKINLSDFKKTYTFTYDFEYLKEEYQFVYELVDKIYLTLNPNYVSRKPNKRSTHTRLEIFKNFICRLFLLKSKF